METDMKYKAEPCASLGATARADVIDTSPDLHPDKRVIAAAVPAENARMIVAALNGEKVLPKEMHAH